MERACGTAKGFEKKPGKGNEANAISSACCKNAYCNKACSKKSEDAKSPAEHYRKSAAILKAMAMAIIFLIIMIPVSSSYALAYSGTIVSTTAKGSDGIDNIIRQTDIINLTTSVTVDNSSVNFTADHLRAVSSLSYSYTNCTGSAGSFVCSLIIPNATYSDGENIVTIKLYDESYAVVDAKNKSLYVDNKAPVVDIKTDSLSYFGIKNKTLSFSITDLACDNCSSYCAGLSSYQITEDGHKIAEENISSCSYTGSISLEPINSSSFELCIKAKDLFSYETRACKNIKKDFSVPDIATNATIKDLEGNKLSYIGNSPIKGTLIISIRDDESGLNLSSVYANLSSFNGSGNSNAACSETENSSYLCSWNITLSSPGSKSFVVAAADLAGNSINETRSIAIPLDNSSPIVNSIKTNAIDSKYIGSSPDISLDITDYGSGLGKANAKLLINGISYNANNCTGSNTNWLCSWKGIKLSGATGSKLTVLATEIYDDVGNKLQSQKAYNFILDSYVPSFKNISIKPLGSDRKTIIADTDVAEITAYIYEQGSGLSEQDTTINVSRLYSEDNGSNSTLVQGSCIIDNSTDEADIGLYKCTWQYSGPFDANKDVAVNIIATDLAGNKRNSKEQGLTANIHISGTQQTKRDFWQDNVRASQIELNKNYLAFSMSGVLLNVPEITILPKTSSNYVHSFELKSCSLNLDNITEASEEANQSSKENSGIVEIKSQQYYSDTDRASKLLIVQLPHINAEALKERSSIEVSCNGEIISSATLKSPVYTPYETVNITIPIKLIDNIFSRPDDAAIDKITEYENILDAITQLIDILSFLMKYIKPICDAFNIARQILATSCTIIKSTTMIVGGTFSGATASCYNAVNKMNKFWYGDNLMPGKTDYFTFGWFCDFFSCSKCGTFFDDLLNKGIDKVFNAKLDTNKASIDIGSSEQKARYFSGLFNPQKSLLAAVVCIPPCIPGIYTRLVVWKKILKNYNKCINIAVIKGEDVAQCDEYLSTQVCMQITGFFWDVAEGIIKSLLVNKLIMKPVNEYLQKCAKASVGDISAACMPFTILEAIDVLLKLKESYDNIESLKKIVSGYTSNDEAE